jgi:hypothetical protein
MILGTLGHLIWHRCDECGMDYATYLLTADEGGMTCPLCGSCSDDDSDDDD